MLASYTSWIMKIQVKHRSYLGFTFHAYSIYYSNKTYTRYILFQHYSNVTSHTLTHTSHTLTYTHTHTHSLTYTHTRIHIHTHIHSHTYTHSHTHTHTHSHTHTHTHMHTLTNTYTHTTNFTRDSSHWYNYSWLVEPFCHSISLFKSF